MVAASSTFCRTFSVQRLTQTVRMANGDQAFRIWPVVYSAS